MQHAGEGNHGGALGHAVAFEHLEAADGEVARDVAVEGRAAGNHLAQAAAKVSLHGREQDAGHGKAVDGGGELEEQSPHG